MNKSIFRHRRFSRWFLNEFTDGASTSSCVRLFHRLTDRWEKLWRRISLRTPFFISFQLWWPLVIPMICTMSNCDGLYFCAKFRWIWCTAFDNIKISIFSVFTYSCLKFGVLGVWNCECGPITGIEQYQPETQNAHPCVSPRRFSHQSIG